MLSHLEPVVGFVAVQAQLFLPGQANPVGSGAFTAAVAGVGMEDPCLFRQMDGCVLYLEHIRRIAALVIGKGFIPAHVLGLGLQHQPDGFVGSAVVEGKCLLAPHVEQKISLAPHVEQKISLAYAASHQNLNGIHAAGIIFRDTYHLLVIGEFQFQQLNGMQHRLL